jgi:uncharacterized protein YoaH (UPF0181 family)
MGPAACLVAQSIRENTVNNGKFNSEYEAWSWNSLIQLIHEEQMINMNTRIYRGETTFLQGIKEQRRNKI